MSYHSEDDTYSCDICGFRSKWNRSDDIHGELWGCEKCGDTFCTSCFIDRHGQKDYMSMMQRSDYILCPECWEKERKNEN